jgi:hypothetical protein
MPVCPKGHPSQATDYCDECGTPMAPMGVPSAGPAAPAPGAPETGTAPAVANPPKPTGETCPECQSPRDGRFCETCGHDFLATSPPAPAASPAPAPAAPSDGPAPGAPGGWRIVATADREYHQRMLAAADTGADEVPFPAYCPERRFALHGSEVLIGRRSSSRGIEPGIDLTGPPEDAAVSHAHALLVRTPEGTWNVVDLDSANGTYVNGSSDQIPANQPVPLTDGDRIHVGAWTTLTVLAG